MVLGSSRFSSSGEPTKKRRSSTRASLHRKPTRINENLEPRMLLAGDPNLISINPNTGSLLEDGQVLNIAPTDLTFRFDEMSILDPESLDQQIVIQRSGRDGIFTNGNEVTINPGFIGLGATSHEVIVRFAETLPDDVYEIEAFDESLKFTLDLGAKVTAVVPQPIREETQGVDTIRVQDRDKIVIYLNDDDLDPQSVQDKNLYQLMFTNDSATNTDDGSVQRPSEIDYDPANDRVVLTFPVDIDQFATGPGTYRLRMGTEESRPNPPEEIDGRIDQGSSFDTAMDLEILGRDGKLIHSAIDIEEFALDYPGDNESPGHRELSYHTSEQHIGDTVIPGIGFPNPDVEPTKDMESGISTVAYVFRDIYGTDPRGVPLRNLITEPQKQRVREIASLYSYYSGVQFFEADEDVLEDLIAQQITVFSIATGDLRAVSPTVPTGPGGVIGIAGAVITDNGDVVPTAIMDSAEVWDDAYGAEEGGGFVSYFRTAMHEVGHLLGLGHTYDLQPGTIMGETTIPGYEPEPVFPGNHDISHMLHLHRPESTDIDMYRFAVEQEGLLTAETFAERQVDAELLDTVISLYRQDDNGNRILIARNDDYFSDDSYVEILLGPGIYFVGVSASGNDEFDADIENSGNGGRSQGKYDLRLNFRPQVTKSLVDVKNAAFPGDKKVAFDGDANGVPGGVYNFWFRADSPANTLFVDKAAAHGGDGSLEAPFNNLRTALTAARSKQALEKVNVTVRVLGNGGADGDLGSHHDNLPYEIGFDSRNRALADGSTLEVPANVTLMIDEGAVFKLRRARIGVGSSSPIVDRSKSALQILGTPDTSVFFTSINDESIGTDTTDVNTTAQPGDWGGILFRNDVDRREGRFEYEQQGIFLNYVNHADFGFGGGEVVIESMQQIVTPIQMLEARPSVSYNRIANSADSAMSADPNSFEETNFHAPIFQQTVFTSDFTRIGPEIHDNFLEENSINGLFVSIKTPAGNKPRKLTVSGRWNDRDIVHLVSENLVIEGTVGGPLHSLSRAPSALGVTLTPDAGGILAEGIYTYKFTFISLDGSESPASGETTPLNIGRGQGTITLANLPRPIAGTGVVGIRVYRSATSGSAPFQLVRQIDLTQRTFVDNGFNTDGRILDEQGTDLSARLDARLSIDPGVVVKLDGAHIDVSFGGQLIAEGRDGAEIIFTSLQDDRYGASSTFDTNNDNDSLNHSDPEPGDWGGIFVGPTSSASVDHGLFAYGGGVTSIEGSFTGFNVFEIHQGKARITNSTFTLNADGTGGQATPDREGRGFNASGTIFIRGAQPIIVGNTIRDNLGAAMNTNPNALDFNRVADHGRATGGIDRITRYADNQGPLIRENQLGGNGTNGMIVRGEVLTTESVWDDTDIVHVVLDEIIIPDFHDHGGLRIESSAAASLVVKLNGEEAGITATGNKLDNDDRIGGSLRVVGQPGFPVVMTSIRDDSVGAGFDPQGRVQTDTDGNGNRFDPGGSLPRGPEVNNGTLIDNDVIVTTPGFNSANIIAGGQVGLHNATIQTQAQVLQNQNLITLFDNYIDTGVNVFNLAGTNITLAPTLVADDVVASEGNFLTGVVPNQKIINWRAESSFADGDTAMFNEITLFTEDDDDVLGSLQVINIFDQNVIGPGGDILLRRGTPGEADFRATVLDDVERLGFGHGGIYDRGDGLVNASYRGWAADIAGPLLANIVAGNQGFSLPGTINLLNLPEIQDDELGTVNGIQDIATAFSWTVDSGAEISTMTSFIELIPRNSSSLAGDWRGLRLDEFSHDRNVDITTERESFDAENTGVNGIPNTAQFLGELAPFERGGDDNRRLGFDVHGLINSPRDIDVYSFVSVAGTEVWLDIDNTSPGLDSVLELVDANGTVLARSDDSHAEAIGEQDMFGIAKPLVHSVFSVPDRYTTNIHDAGMRVILPGASGVPNTYHVQVRSAGTDIDDLQSGLTQGGYQLQIRLKELDEVPGSTIQFADIRNAVTGIEILGQPAHSPLLGEAGETTAANDTRATAQDLGSILETNRGALILQGSLDAPTDLDWYQFDARLPGTQASFTGGSPGEPAYVSLTFDVDFTDGFGRPDLSLWLYNDNGELIYSSRDSAIEDDRPTESGLATLSDLQAGSVGASDPYLGTVELPEGTYFLAVSNASRRVPNALDQQLIRAEPVNSLIRVAEDRVTQSIGSNIAAGPIVPILFTEDFAIIPPDDVSELQDGESFIITGPTGERVTYEFDTNGRVSGANIPVPYDPLFDTGFTVQSTLQSLIGVNGPNGITVGFGTTSANEVVLQDAVGVKVLPARGQANAGLYVSKPARTPFRLGDVTMFVTQDSGLDQSRLITIDPYTGFEENTIGIFPQNVADITIRPDNGLLYGYTVPEQMPTDQNSGNLISIDHASLATQNLSTAVGDDGITPFWLDPANPANPVNSNDGVQFDAITLGGGIRQGLTGFAVGHRGLFQPNGVQGPTRNLLYEFDPNTGVAFSLPGPLPVDRQGIDLIQGGGTQIRERGQLDLLTDPIGLGNSALSFVDATDVNISGTTIPRIQDGLQFVVDDGLGTQFTFEFNTGPEVVVSYNPTLGQFVRDGDTFLLDGTAYEFDTGSVLVVTALNGNGVFDGETITITDDQIPTVTKTFEFDDGSGPPIGQGNFRIPFNSGFDQADIINGIVNSINAVGNYNIEAIAVPGTNRISLIRESDQFGAISTSSGVSVQGSPGGAGLLVPVEESMTLSEFGQAIVQSVPGAGFDGTRLNFSSFMNGDFRQIATRGVFQNVITSSGDVTPGAIGVDFLASDGGFDLAQRVLIEMQLNTPLLATAPGSSIVMQAPAFIVSADPPLRIGGTAPGGDINGMAIVNGSIWAVTGQDPLGQGGGGLYRIVGELTNAAFADYIETSGDLLTGGRNFFGQPTGGPINFAALSAGPDNLDDGRYAEMLFGMDVFGNLYAFDLEGNLQPVFEDSQVSVSTGLFGATGFAFSTLDMNLWHVTERRRGDAGHGYNFAPDVSRLNENPAGNVSLYFGFENPNVMAGNWAGINDPGIRNSYAFPGGAHGSIESNSIDLSSFSPLDRPTLYFNYFLDTEQTIGDVAPPPFHRDSFRVFVSADDGEWQLIGTNNEFRARGDADDEFDYAGFVSTQELLDNAGWREMRVDMSNFAGSDSVRLRFDFNTAGAFDIGNPLTGGDEIRAVDADKIADGDALLLQNARTFFPETFEFDFGYVLVAPAGTNLVDGQTFELNDGIDEPITFEFDLGDGIGGNNNIAIPFDNGLSAGEVAEAIENSIRLAYGIGTVQLDLLQEENDTVAQAARTSFSEGNIVGSGNIGDNPQLFGANQSRDVDLIEITLEAGQQVTVDIDTDPNDFTALTDSYVRLFDSDGTQVAFNDDGLAPNETGLFTFDSYLDVVVAEPGTYYIGISGNTNTNYDPSVSGSGSQGATGNYRVDVHLLPAVIDPLAPVSTVDTHRLGAIVDLDGIINLTQAIDSPIQVVGAPGVQPFANPIELNVLMGDDEVAMQLRTAIATAFGSGDPLGIPGYNDVVQLLGHEVIDPGPLGLSVTGFFDEDEIPPFFFSFDQNGLDGDLFGSFDASTLPDGTTDQNFPGFLRGQNNNFEGVYIDDIVIGFTERGEMYTAAAADDTFATLPFDPNDTRIKVGDYQLEIRPSQHYGIPVTGDIELFLTEAYHPRDRLADNVTVTVVSGSDIADGSVIRISDGTRSLELEFEDSFANNGISTGRVAVPFNNTDSAATVANTLTDILNSSTVQDFLEISAASPIGANQIELFGNASVTTDIGLESAALAETNDTILDAIDSKIAPGEGLQFQGIGRIGDNPQIGAGLDVDLLKFELDKGQRISIDVDSLDAPIDTMLRLFDANGVEIALSDDDPAPGELNTREPYITYTATAPGIFYVGVSGFSNSNYDPLTEASGLRGNTGDYQIEMVVGGANEILQVNVEKGYGDLNPFRDQGQLIVHSTQITNSAQFGILIDEGTRTTPDEFPHQGTPRVLFNTNAERLFTGVTIKNNVIAFNRNGGIRYSGDPSTQNHSESPVPFGRIVNNTLIGGMPFQTNDFLDASPIGTGVQIDENASPTLLNNIITNFEVGIDVDLTSQSTVIGGTLYQSNIANSNKGLGDAAIELLPEDALFVNRDEGNFYLAEDSSAIDSSVNSLADRPAIVNISSPLGIPVSPILAPNLDITGLLRVDDPRVDTPAGQGENVFKDRGAIDRADFLGPTAVLSVPRDNSEEDKNPVNGIVQINNPAITSFNIQLLDGLTESQIQRGSGIDPSSVISDLVQVSRNRVELEEGVDYLFSFDTASKIIRLTPLSGIWQPGRVYDITLGESKADQDKPESERARIRDLANNVLQPNNEFGTTTFTISIGGEDQDFGDAPQIYPTLLLNNGASHVLGEGYRLGVDIDSEPNGQPTNDASGDGDSDDGVVFVSQLIPGRSATISVNVSLDGFLDAWIDFDGDGDWNDSGEQIANSLALAAGDNSLTVSVPTEAELGSTFARFRFSRDGGLQPTGLALTGEVEDYIVDVESAAPWQNKTNRLDVNQDGFVAPSDVLMIINELNNPRVSNAVNGKLQKPEPPLSPEFNNPGFVDVDGDGFVAPLDALLIVNFLNRNMQPLAAVATVGESIDDATVRAALEFPEAIDEDHVDRLVVANENPSGAKKQRELELSQIDSLFDEDMATDFAIEDIADEVSNPWNNFS